MKNIESVVKHVLDIWRDVYHLNKPSEETIEFKDDNSNNDDDDDENTHSIIVIVGELHVLIEEKE